MKGLTKMTEVLDDSEVSKNSQSVLESALQFEANDYEQAVLNGTLQEAFKFDIKQIVNSYLETMLWAEMDDEDEPLDSNYSISDVDKGSVKKAEDDIKKFLKKAGHLIDTDNPTALDRIGHNFWLTRKGHGAGFWDDEKNYPKGKEISKIIEKEFKNDPYPFAQDGNVYVEGVVISEKMSRDEHDEIVKEKKSLRGKKSYIILMKSKRDGDYSVDAIHAKDDTGAIRIYQLNKKLHDGGALVNTSHDIISLFSYNGNLKPFDVFDDADKNVDVKSGKLPKEYKKLADWNNITELTESMTMAKFIKKYKKDIDKVIKKDGNNDIDDEERRQYVMNDEGLYNMALEMGVKELNEKVISEKFAMNDDLLGGITFGELIDTVSANEANSDEKTIKKVYKEILKMKLEDAEYELKKNIKQIMLSV